mmetsp:Transcript_13393/g.41796  ORF Transcript_13393/g.41796 Transcript_13393/m.41796 type:complete len:241 (+) Transcript_13393:94-816(+)
MLRELRGRTAWPRRMPRTRASPRRARPGVGQTPRLPVAPPVPAPAQTVRARGRTVLPPPSRRAPRPPSAGVSPVLTRPGPSSPPRRPPRGRRLCGQARLFGARWPPLRLQWRRRSPREATRPVEAASRWRGTRSSTRVSEPFCRGRLSRLAAWSCSVRSSRRTTRSIRSSSTSGSSSTRRSSSHSRSTSRSPSCSSSSISRSSPGGRSRRTRRLSSNSSRRMTSSLRPGFPHPCPCRPRP